MFVPNQSGEMSINKGKRRSATRKAMKAKDKPTKGSGKKSVRKGAMEEEVTAI